MPAATEAIPRWADHLAAHRFGEQVSSAGQPRGFVDIAGTRTFTLGSVNAATVVLPGLPGNADTWTDVLGDRSDLQVVDLPGSGLSSGGSGDWQGWADRIVSNPAVSRLIGHGTSAAVAIAAADRHPGHLDELTLVSPFFLMPLAKHGYRTTRRHLRGVPPHALSRELTGSGNSAHSLASTVSDLRRHRHAATAAAQLRRTLDPSWRAELVGQLARYPGLVHLVVGTEEPWAAEARPALARLGDRLRVTVIDGAGDHPQLTHADQLAHRIAPSRTLSSP